MEEVNGPPDQSATQFSPNADQIIGRLREILAPKEKHTNICPISEAELLDCNIMSALAKEASAAYALSLEKISALDALRKAFWEKACRDHGLTGKNVRINVETKQFILVETMADKPQNN